MISNDAIGRVLTANTFEEINDSMCQTYSWQDLAGKQLTIRGVKAKPSDHRSEPFAVVSFDIDNDSGVFLIGGRTARYFLSIEEWKFPVSLILHGITGQNGHVYPRVERVR